MRPGEDKQINLWDQLDTFSKLENCENLGEKSWINSYLYCIPFIVDNLLNMWLMFRVSSRTFYRISPVQYLQLPNRKIIYTIFTGNVTCIFYWCQLNNLFAMLSEFVLTTTKLIFIFQPRQTSNELLYFRV